MTRRSTRTAVALVLLALAGCSHGSGQPAAKLTEHQRDSVLAQEPIPGAPAVGSAMRAADREERRADKLDSLAQ